MLEGEGVLISSKFPPGRVPVPLPRMQVYGTHDEEGLHGFLLLQLIQQLLSMLVVLTIHTVEVKVHSLRERGKMNKV